MWSDVNLVETKSDIYQLGQMLTEGHLRCLKIECVAKTESKDTIPGQVGRRHRRMYTDDDEQLSWDVEDLNFTSKIDQRGP